MFGVIQDITEQRQAEQAVRQLSEFNEGILRNMSEGIVLEGRTRLSRSSTLPRPPCSATRWKN